MTRDMTPNAERDSIHPRRIVFDGTINAGHVLSILSMVAAVAIGWTTLDKRVVVLEEAKAYQAARDATQDQVVRDTVTRIERSVDKIAAGLEQLKDERRSNGR